MIIVSKNPAELSAVCYPRQHRNQYKQQIIPLIFPHYFLLLLQVYLLEGDCSRITIQLNPQKQTLYFEHEIL
jgi:hypothetical protein